ncbi:uncharacterized protein LOC124927741 isoform X2 [Impatiens glandulifera]|uniref:uncharacterized protein LOC124927741 isoform X2 n=1 Tax=Impatiens glandulifera TaxID=253017 RepID=UPI001FB0A580|nr:uncharacterized protein LOC124927741 isoform X2 [Impatiens glandulifera]
MVLGIKSKKNGTKFKLEYYVNVQEIKPCPPSSQSLKAINYVQLQWVNGDKSSGLLSTSVVNGIIEFNETFLLPVTLRKQKKTHDNFLKNNLEFYLYESQQDKLGRGQLLGTAIVNLADYGIIKQNINISVTLNCKKIEKSFIAQPVLFLNVQPSDLDGSTQSFNESLSNDGGGEFDDDRSSEVASFTDDDTSSHSSRTVSSHSSQTVSSLSPLRKEIAQGRGKVHENSQLSARYSSVDKTPTPIPTESIYSELEAMTSYDANIDLIYGKEKKEPPQENVHTPELLFGNSRTSSARKTTLRSETLTSRKLEEKSKSSSKLKHMKSVQISFNSARINGLFSHKTDKTKETDNQEDIHNKSTMMEEKGSSSTYATANEWKSKVEMLEEELKETAVLEAALYSIVSEHCSSTNKVHSPARRLSRFYIHACKSMSLVTKASAAKAAVSGFILVSRSCGNDVPRLTFWLSNLIMMRTIVNQAVGNVSSSCENVKANNNCGGAKFVRNREKIDQSLIEELDGWENAQTFIIAMEKVEAWIFWRIVESVWWQTLTPHMQPNSGKNSLKGSNSRKTRHVLGGEEQGNSSIELWRKAFKDAGERLCPIRAGGHECACLPVISRLVMEQLVNRLDVAMFNAILRESADEMPTDPVSDPITDSKVLPIPAGKSGFGAGAQLKNAVGNWSRWLADLFGVEDIDSLEENDIQEDDNKPTMMTSSFKSFRLLNALSELMMLPIGMLSDGSTRKEVCPLLGPKIIKRVLQNFVPDEFSPRPIPRAVFNSLEEEEEEEMMMMMMIRNFPCIANNGAAIYLAPLATEMGSAQSSLQRTTSSILKKSYTSDDELDELDSPFTSINLDKARRSNYPGSLKPNWIPTGARTSVRYQLLRQVWEQAE